MDKAEREKLRSFAQAAIDSTEFGDYEWYTDDPMSVSGRDADYVAALKPQILIALLDHIDALERDALRYRWLRTQPNEDTEDCLISHRPWCVQIEHAPGIPQMVACNYATLDAAIDQAIAAAPEPQS